MLAERLEADELMDDPALPAGTYREVLADLARVNRATVAYRHTRDSLRRAAGSRRAFRLLDVGFGQGDMLRRIARGGEKRGSAAELVGCDLNPNSIAAADAVA
jgi:ubiquinone/menaquinone biosynthesis C-methylase UbiE